MVGNAVRGIHVRGGDGIDIRHNFISHNAGPGIDAAGATFAHLDSNAYYQNADGPCVGCEIGPASLAVVPLFVDKETLDLRLEIGTTPLLDAGVDLGVDVNGPEAGNFN